MDYIREYYRGYVKDFIGGYIKEYCTGYTGDYGQTPDSYNGDKEGTTLVILQ